ncbi:MAG: glycosyltransferase family 2 protein [Sulfurimonas sp.]|nr:glycosyltransferase family 2 protein [Sulfurimonas sp.]
MIDKTVWILLLNFNGYEDTLECIETLFTSKSKQLKLLIVDNASTDNSLININKWLESKDITSSKVFYKTSPDMFSTSSKENSNITLISSDSNNGYAAGNNIGIKYVLQHASKKDFIWILNNDTLVRPDTLENMINSYNQLENDAIALLGSKILNEDLSLQSIGDIIENTNEKNKDNLEVKHICGCSIFFRVENFDSIGFLPEEYFLYYEETDWMKSIRQKGLKIFTSLKSEVIHKHAKSTGGAYSPLVLYYMTRNQILFHKKYFGAFAYSLVVFKLFFRNILRVIYYFFYDVKLSKSIFKGTIDGIRNVKGKQKIS